MPRFHGNRPDLEPNSKDYKGVRQYEIDRPTPAGPTKAEQEERTWVVLKQGLEAEVRGDYAEASLLALHALQLDPRDSVAKALFDRSQRLLHSRRGHEMPSLVEEPSPFPLGTEPLLPIRDFSAPPQATVPDILDVSAPSPAPGPEVQDFSAPPPAPARETHGFSAPPRAPVAETHDFSAPPPGPVAETNDSFLVPPVPELGESLRELRPGPNKLSLPGLRDFPVSGSAEEGNWTSKAMARKVVPLVLFVLVIAMLWRVFDQREQSLGPAPVSSAPVPSSRAITQPAPKGNLAIDIEPWAEIKSIVRASDGAQLEHGRLLSPCTVTLPPGRYLFTAEHPDFGPLKFAAVVESGRTVNVRHSLLNDQVLEEELKPVLDSAGN